MPVGPKLTISAKDLGALALPGFCPRCFWLERHFDLPFQGGFPGIFSSIDSYTKKIVHDSFDSGSGCPKWLSSLGPVKSYISPPSYRKFFVDDPATEVRLTGSADGILVLEDNTLVIVDYKTARFTETQDAMRPIYDIQLNGYARIADHIGLGKVSRLALVYTEPVTQGGPDLFSSHRTTGGFKMGFEAKIVDVRLDPGQLDPLLRRAVDIHGLPEPPRGNPGCNDCHLFEELIAERTRWTSP